MLKSFIQGIIGLIKIFGKKPKLSTVLTEILARLPELVMNVITIGGMNTKEKFDEFLETLDAYTGEDIGAVDLDHDMPKDKQEEFWDAIKTAARVQGYHLLKVPGYYI